MCRFLSQPECYMITLTTEQKALIKSKLTDYLLDELDVELGDFDADFLTDFVIEKFGPYFYNQGLKDAQTALMSKLDYITEAIDEIELVIDER